MMTVGEILATARLKQKITFDQVEKATHIRQKFLVALEKNEFSKLPPGIFTKGFIKNYAAYLGLPVNETLAFYRRQVNEEKNSLIPTVNPNSPKTSSAFSFVSPTSIGIAILLILFFSYLIYSYLRFAGAPMLIINSPAKNAVVNQEQVEVMGQTSPDAAIIINNQPVNINENGSFSVKITLTPGLNTITVTATNKFGRQSIISRNLRLEK
jgi:cytoskeletal protein RodZ